MSSVLYISLTGMTQALGKSQVASYLKPLSKANQIFLISFEREGTKAQQQSMQLEFDDHNISWYPLRYTNRFGTLSTIFQLIVCVSKGLSICVMKNIDVVHARSLIPGVMAYFICLLSPAKFLFDIRDFFTEEKVDGGRIKRNSFIYKILLGIEHHLYKSSDFIVALTHVSKRILIEKFCLDTDRISVVPTCADSNVFYPISESQKKRIRENNCFSPQDFICIHVGTVTGWYLFDQELLFFKELKKHKSNAKFLILNQDQHSFIHEKLAEFSVDITDIVLLDVPFEKVNSFINIADVALYFIVPSYSKQAAAPTKFAEFVRVHLPSITNPGIGDMNTYILDYETGVMVDPYNINIDSVKETLVWLDNFYTSDQKNNFCDLYDGAFSISSAVTKYQSIYDELTNE